MSAPTIPSSSPPRAAYTPHIVLKLRRLKIDRFRNVAPGTELHFDDGVNVLLGKNATGKTTLLGLISSTLRGDFAEFEGEPLHVDATFQGVEPPVQLELRCNSNAGQSTWWFKVVAATIEVEGTHEVTKARFGETVVALPPTSPFGPGLLYRLDRALGHRLKLTPFYASSMFRFDESLESFIALTSGTAAAQRVQAGSVIPPMTLDVIRDEDQLNRVGLDLIPPELAQAAVRCKDDAQALLPSDWATLLGFKEITWHAQLLEAGPISVDQVVKTRARYGRFSFRAARRDGSILLHERFSYGQKRLLALLYYLESNSHVLIADELVNGLHHDWIEELLSRLGQRQAFLTSQNPLLFDFLKIESAEQVERMFVMCESSEDERGAVTLKWRNMTADEAKAFYEELAIGADFVSEVLLRRGLW